MFTPSRPVLAVRAAHVDGAICEKPSITSALVAWPFWVPLSVLATKQFACSWPPITRFPRSALSVLPSVPLSMKVLPIASFPSGS